MAAIITSKFRFHNAEQFKESFSERRRYQLLYVHW